MLRDWVGVTLITTPIAIGLLYVLVRYTSLASWIIISLVLIIGTVVPHAYETHVQH